MNKRSLLLSLKIYSYLLLFNAVTGCQSFSAVTEWWSNDQPKVDVISLTLLQSKPVDDEAATQLQAVINEFNLVNEAITVTLRYENQYGDLLARSTLSEIDHDLLLIDSFHLPDLAVANAIQPLPPSFTQSSQLRLDDFYPSLLDAFTLNGELYCLPNEFRTLAMVYNKALFDEAGIAYPREGWTWTEFRAAAEAIADTKNDFYTTYGFVLSTDASRWLPFLYQNGGGLLAADRKTSIINSDAALSAMNFYFGLFEDGFAAPTSTFLSSWSGQAFGGGRVGMIVEGNWIQPYLDMEYPQLEYGIVALPIGSAGPATIAFSSCYALSGQTENLSEAITLLRYLSTPTTMRRLNEGNVAAPPRLSLQSEWVQQNESLLPFLTGGEYARPWRFVPNYQIVIDSISSNMKRVLAVEIPTEEVLRVAEELSNEVIE